eukprot:scaffold256449_cov28-Tisochrysis_lutea.AAC.6
MEAKFSNCVRAPDSSLHRNNGTNDRNESGLAAVGSPHGLDARCCRSPSSELPTARSATNQCLYRSCSPTAGKIAFGSVATHRRLQPHAALCLGAQLVTPDAVMSCSTSTNSGLHSNTTRAFFAQHVGSVCSSHVCLCGRNAHWVTMICKRPGEIATRQCTEVFRHMHRPIQICENGYGQRLTRLNGNYERNRSRKACATHRCTPTGLNICDRGDESGRLGSRSNTSEDCLQTAQCTPSVHRPTSCHSACHRLEKLSRRAHAEQVPRGE